MNKKHPTTSFSYGRIIVVLWFGMWLSAPGASFFFEILGFEQKWYSWIVFYSYYTKLIVSLSIFAIVVVWKIRWGEIIGKGLSLQEISLGLKLTIFLIIFSIAADYALTIPLSYLFPNFVQWWFLGSTSIIFYDSGSYPALANILGFISVVVITPVIEEISFRGLLLRRWTEKWNMLKAILLSSLIFGVLHSDPIGAFAFGLGMCVLYLKTQSLYLPIVCHAANNLLAWLIEAGYFLMDGPSSEYTIEDLRSEWYIGVICGSIAVLWAIRRLKKPIKSYEWKLPST